MNWIKRLFTCTQCQQKDLLLSDLFKKLALSAPVVWKELKREMPPSNQRLLVASPDFTYFGFATLESGWEPSLRINLYGKNRAVYPTYFTPDNIGYWMVMPKVESVTVDSE